jgi:hypothetical protein
MGTSIAKKPQSIMAGAFLSPAPWMEGVFPFSLATMMEVFPFASPGGVVVLYSNKL